MCSVSSTTAVPQRGAFSDPRGHAASELHDTAMAEPRYVACPQCGAKVAWAPTSRWRPFCTERCKLIDLGAWASEKYRVAVEPPDEDSAPEGDAARPRDD
jgi:uncharacterized protein